MDRSSWNQQDKGRISAWASRAAVFVGVSVIVLAAGLRAAASDGETPDGDRQQTDAERVAMLGKMARILDGHEESIFSRWIGDYTKAWDSVQQKVEGLRTAELENERLRLENAHLRIEMEGLHFNCSAKDAASQTHSIEYKLDKDTGNAMAKDLASISYRVPTNLMPGQLYALGISYFKARDDEKAAVIFTFLTGMDGNNVFRTPRNELITGIAWYRLDNLPVADRYFSHAIKAKETRENLQTLAQARLWKAIIASRQGRHDKSQFWLGELVDHHPRSVEAGWVNNGINSGARSEARRGVASDPE